MRLKKIGAGAVAVSFVFTAFAYGASPSPTPTPKWTAPSGKEPTNTSTLFNHTLETPSPTPTAVGTDAPTAVIVTDDDQAKFDSAHSNPNGVNTVRTRVLTMRGMAATPVKPTIVQNLVNKGGPLLNQVNIYPIWWGPANQWPANYQSIVLSALNGMSCAATTCTQTTGLLNQYFPTAAKANIAIGTQYSDLTAPPSNSPTTSAILTEVNKLVGNSRLDPKGLYLVFTSNFPRWSSFCAWHSAGSVSNKWFTVGYMPNLTGVAGCSIDWFSNYPQANQAGHSLGADSEVNILTHEIYETMTDPMLNNRWGWVDSTYSEIGDKCIWASKAASTQLSLANGTTWTVQTEWSNSVSGCAASL